MIPALRQRAPAGRARAAIAERNHRRPAGGGPVQGAAAAALGGYELDIHTYFDVQMALGEGDMSAAWVYGVVGVHPGSSRYWTIARRKTSGARTRRR